MPPRKVGAAAKRAVAAVAAKKRTAAGKKAGGKGKAPQMQLGPPNIAAEGAKIVAPDKTEYFLGARLASGGFGHIHFGEKQSWGRTEHQAKSQRIFYFIKLTCRAALRRPTRNLWPRLFVGWRGDCRDER